jgi:hypothetical protein
VEGETRKRDTQQRFLLLNQCSSSSALPAPCCSQVAYAHVRGGGELGRSWHAAGRGPNRPFALKDYLSCLRFLVRERYTCKGRVAGYATSAGASGCRHVCVCVRPKSTL